MVDEKNCFQLSQTKKRRHTLEVLEKFYTNLKVSTEKTQNFKLKTPTIPVIFSSPERVGGTSKDFRNLLE